MKYEGFEFAGSVSWGTMRERDLIPAFYDVIEALDAGKAKSLRSEYLPVFRVMEEGIWDFVDNACREANRYNPDSKAMERWFDLVGYCLESLFDVLDELAPDGYYFGASEGDGSDYGFWMFDTEEE